MNPVVDILLITYDSPDYLYSCVQSILDAPAAVGLKRIIVVNNGRPEIVERLPKHPDILVLQMDKNYGWEGGLKRGLEVSTAPYVLFMNDDTYVPLSSGFWLNNMLRHFNNPEVGAVGPASNTVMGFQNIFAGSTIGLTRASFLIGFCMMLRREALDKVGGVDAELPYHGDDLDISIRLRKAGYELLIDRTVFVFHHGFKTGQREFGGYWNSGEMQEKTAHHLIRKHGLRAWRDTLSNQVISPRAHEVKTDSEGDIVRKYVEGEVLEIGCGSQKTVPHAIGVDFVPAETIVGTTGNKSVADVVADANHPLPFEDGRFDTVIARHILEHLPDTLEALANWKKILKHGGKLIIAVPNEEICRSIPLNIEHCHSFTPSSLEKLAKAAGFKTVALEDSRNGVSLVGVFESNGLH